MSMSAAGGGAGGINPQAQALINSIMANKAGYGSANAAQQKQMATQNQQYYGQLSSMLGGQDVQGLIGGGVGLQQALQNVNKLNLMQPAQQQSAPSYTPPQYSPLANNDAFSNSGLLSAQQGIQKAAGSDVPVETAKYQDPQQIAQLYNQMQQVLQPITDAQMKQQQDLFNTNMQNEDSKWSQRGLLATGAAAGANAQATNALNDQLQKFQADQNTQALTFGNDYANLGLKEAQQIFDQGNTNRQTNINTAKDSYDAYLQGIGSQQNAEKQNFDEYTGQQNINMAANKQNFDQGVTVAGLTGMYNGQQTQAAQKQAFDEGIQQGQLTGQYNGQQTLAAQDQAQKNALAVGQETGTYMDPQAQSLIQQIMNNKAGYGSASAAQQQQMAAQNQQDYNALSAILGKNVAPLIGSGVGLNQAYQNLAGLGTQTLQSKTDSVDNTVKLGDLAIQQQNANDNTAKTNADISNQQNALAIQKMTAQSDADYKKWQENMGITQQQGQAATSGYTSQAIGQGNMQAAVKWLFNHASDIAKDGADMKTILASVESVYPGATKALTAASNSPLGSVNGAPVQGPTVPAQSPNLQP